MRVSAPALAPAIASAFCVSAATPAADPPAAPSVQVTVGSDLKTLVFDWDRVPGAQFYQIHYKPGVNAGFAPLGGKIQAPQTGARVAVPAHRLDWPNARYIVSACNARRCRDSAEISVADQMPAVIGYVKASNSEMDDQFGRSVLLSDDGKTLVVNAGLESSNATGVNGDQSNNDSQYSGAVYVFRQEADSWRQEAYLKGDVNNPDQFFGWGYPVGSRALAVSADGNLVAVGAPGEMRDARSYVGAVYVFARAADGSWSQAQKLQAPVPAATDFYGASVDLSHDGNTLKVTSLLPRDGEGNPEGRHHVYTRVGGVFVHEKILAPPTAGWFCMGARLSGDGETIVSGCINYSGVAGPDRVITRKRHGGSWDVVANLPGEYFANEVALTPDGTRLAMRHAYGTFSEVRTWQWTGSEWSATGVIPEAVRSDGNSWASSLAWDREGRHLAIGDSLSQVSGAGVSNEIQPKAESGSFGAVFLYERVDAGGWTLKRQIKSPNSEAGDTFGRDVSLSGDGEVLAVSAIGEDSVATGIDGDQSNNAADEAGAVYLY